MIVKVYRIENSEKKGPYTDTKIYLDKKTDTKRFWWESKHRKPHNDSPHHPEICVDIDFKNLKKYFNNINHLTNYNKKRINDEKKFDKFYDSLNLYSLRNPGVYFYKVTNEFEYVCGFASLKDLNKWFSKTEKKKLFSYGYKVKVYYVDEIDIAYGKKQLIFYHPNIKSYKSVDSDSDIDSDDEYGKK